MVSEAGSNYPPESGLQSPVFLWLRTSTSGQNAIAQESRMNGTPKGLMDAPPSPPEFDV